MKMLTECSASYSWVFISSSIYLVGKRLFRVQHLLWSLCHKAFQNAYTEAWERSWRNTKDGAGLACCAVSKSSAPLERQQGGCVPFLRLSRKRFCLSWAFVKCRKLESCTMLTSQESLNTQTKQWKGIVFYSFSIPPPTPWYTCSVMSLAEKREWILGLYFFCPLTALP